VTRRRCRRRRRRGQDGKVVRCFLLLLRLFEGGGEATVSVGPEGRRDALRGTYITRGRTRRRRLFVARSVPYRYQKKSCAPRTWWPANSARSRWRPACRERTRRTKTWPSCRRSCRNTWWAPRPRPRTGRSSVRWNATAGWETPKPPLQVGLALIVGVPVPKSFPGKRRTVSWRSSLHLSSNCTAKTVRTCSRRVLWKNRHVS